MRLLMESFLLAVEERSRLIIFLFHSITELRTLGSSKVRVSSPRVFFEEAAASPEKKLFLEFRSPLPPDRLNTHCVNLISKEATICLLTTIHCDLNAPVALKIGPQKETQQLCPADYLWTTLLMMSRLRSSSIL